MGRVIRGMIAGRRSGRSIALLTAKWNAEDLAVLAGLLENRCHRPGHRPHVPAGRDG